MGKQLGRWAVVFLGQKANDLQIADATAARRAEF
jgi:hypothetical protein